MAETIKVDVAIVGAGLVGASLACLLAKGDKSRALRIALIEAVPFKTMQGASGFDPRVVALTEKSRRLLDACGVWNAVAADRVSPYTAMQVWDAEGTGRIGFDCRDVHQPNLGHIVENSVLVKALLEQLATLEQINVMCPARIENIDAEHRHSEISLTLGNAVTINTALLVAADGARSAIRERFAIKVREWEYGQNAIVTTIRSEQSHRRTAWQRFMPTGPLALLPLDHCGDLHYSSIVWSQDSRRADELMQLDDASFCEALSAASEFCLGNILETDRRFCIPLVQRHAADYVVPRVALVGDAAHSIHPLAGQGANLGLADVQVLAEEIERAVERGSDFGESLVLERYQRRRKPDNLATMAAMEGFKRLFAADLLPVRFLRSIGLSQIDKLQPIKNELIKLAMGL